MIVTQPRLLSALELAKSSIPNTIISVIMKNNRGKENNQICGNQWVASTYRVESDQKDVIIKTLRGDQETLRKN